MTVSVLKQDPNPPGVELHTTTNKQKTYKYIFIYHRLTIVRLLFCRLQKRGSPEKFAYVLYCYIKLQFFLNVDKFGSKTTRGVGRWGGGGGQTGISSLTHRIVESEFVVGCFGRPDFLELELAFTLVGGIVVQFPFPEEFLLPVHLHVKYTQTSLRVCTQLYSLSDCI